MSVSLKIAGRNTFYEPTSLWVDVKARARHESTGATSTIAMLFKDIRSHPVVALGAYGAGSFDRKAEPLTNYAGSHQLYGWKGSSRLKAPTIHVIVLGAKVESDGQAYVCFVHAEEQNKAADSLMINYSPHETEKRVFVLSYKSFRSRLELLYRPPYCYGKFKWLSGLTSSQLTALSEEVKQVGQRLFDKYKSKFDGNSNYAFEGVARICDSFLLMSTNHTLYRQVELYWDGIGDDMNRWQG